MLFEEMIIEIKKQWKLKTEYNIGDVFIAAIEFEVDNKVDFHITYLRLDEIESDNNKVNWWNCSFSAFTYPISRFTWTVRKEQLEGEIFTMGGLKRWLSCIDFDNESQEKPKEIRETHKSNMSNTSNTSNNKTQHTKESNNLIRVDFRKKESQEPTETSDSPSVA